MPEDVKPRTLTIDEIKKETISHEGDLGRAPPPKGEPKMMNTPLMKPANTRTTKK